MAFRVTHREALDNIRELAATCRGRVLGLDIPAQASPQVEAILTEITAAVTQLAAVVRDLDEEDR